MTKATLSVGSLGNSQRNDLDNEIDRDLLFHYISKSILNGNFSCPFNNSMQQCLDIGYSSGNWMMEMATDFPQCQFHGIDNEPNSPELVYPRNCFFERGDYLKGLPYPDNTFDMVHLRMTLFSVGGSVGGGIEKIKFLLSEIGRVTKFNGYVEFLEPSFDNSGSLGPLLNKLLDHYMCNSNAAVNKIDQLLSEGGFTSISNDKVAIPLSRGSMLGEFSMAALKLCINNIDTNALNIVDLQNFIDLIERECEQYKPHINVFSGFAQKKF